MNRLLTIVLLAAAPLSVARADDFGGTVADFEANYGVAYGSEEQPIDAGTRDANGNRLIVNGRIMGSSSLSGGVGDSDGAAFNQSIAASSAIGNQLNVITSGSFNTVIVDSTQNNSGDITATVGGDH